MTENDKKLLVGNRHKICAYFAKRKAIKKIGSLVDEANKILEKYKGVTFDNALETAFFQTDSLFLKETYWSNDVENAFKEIFGGHQSDIARQIRNVVVINELHLYAKTRSTLEKKRDILIEFREELEEL